MPAPRKNESAAGGFMQRTLAWPYRAILAFLIWTGVRPWQLTAASPVFIVLSGWQIVEGNWAVAGVLLLIVGALCDVFDGSVARHRGESGRSGAFMDSVLDRVSDMILFSCLFWNLAAKGDTLEAGLALLTLVVSLSVSPDPRGSRSRRRQACRRVCSNDWKGSSRCWWRCGSPA